MKSMAELLTLPPVAKSVLYNCKKCGTERYHRVLAHKTSTTASIQCEICSSKKTFKLETPKKSSSSSPKKAVVRKTTVSKTLAPSLWQDMNNKIGPQSAEPYSIKGNFNENDAIIHTKFGIGYVTKVEAQRIEVVFQDSIKQLVHNR